MDTQWFIDRLKEPSTWKGFISLITAGGVFALTPEQNDAALNTLVAGGSFLGLLYGAIQIIWKRDSQVKT